MPAPIMMNDAPYQAIETPARSGNTVGRKWSVSGVCIALVLLVFAVFGRAIGFDFVNLDDLVYIPSNPMVSKGLSLEGIGWAFTHFHGALWHPLTVTVFMLDCQLFGMWPGGYHLVNILLHAAAVVLLFLLLLNMTGALRRSAFAAALFAIHPLRAESVIWITECKDVLSGMFFMLTLLAYVRYARGPKTVGRYLLVMLCFALGLMSKSMLVTVPGVLLLLDYWPLGRLQRLSQVPALVLEKIPLFLLSILSSVATVMAIKADNHAPSAAVPSDAPMSYVIYLGKLIYPHDLALPYPMPEHGWAAWQAGGAIFLLAGLTAGAFLLGRKRPYLLTGWLWYMGMLVPVAGVMQTDYPQPYADRFTYLPQIGLCIAGTWLAADWAARRRIPTAILGGAGAVIIAALMAACWHQVSYWRNSITLWTHTLGCTRDNYYANYILGNALLLQGRNEEAVVQFRESLRIDPAHKETHLDLGTALLRLHRTGDAVADFREALKLDPSSAAIHSYLATALLGEGNIEAAKGEYHEAARLDPSYSRGLNEIGNALLQSGRVDEGIAEYREALRLDPGNAITETNLGNALFQQGMAAEAIAHLENAITHQPDNGTIQNYLAWMLATAPQASLRDGARALDLATKATQGPGGRNAYFLRTLAAAYAAKGDFANAIETAQSALQIAGVKPDLSLADTLRGDIKLYRSGRTISSGR